MTMFDELSALRSKIETHPFVPREARERLTDELDAILAEYADHVVVPRETAEKYHELIYNVATKHPGESRHETALRYIRQAETPSNNYQAAAKEES